mmetsp:Transcript_7156/g.12891  ORF Transcript_7156/g.12891 Transcript_7156/m.12891 type:complete len:133 (+) Transcript_7156:176-574(+)
MESSSLVDEFELTSSFHLGNERIGLQIETDCVPASAIQLNESLTATIRGGQCDAVRYSLGYGMCCQSSESAEDDPRSAAFALLRCEDDVLTLCSSEELFFVFDGFAVVEPVVAVRRNNNRSDPIMHRRVASF